MSGIRRLLSSLAFSTFLVALAGPLPAGAQEAAAAPPPAAAGAADIEPAIPNAKCFACHDDAEMKNEAGNSVAVHRGAVRRLRAQESSIASSATRPPWA